MAHPVQMNDAQFQQLLHQVGALAAPQAPGASGIKLAGFSSGEPSEWRTWRANFLTLATIHNWNDVRQRREASAAMSGVAARSVRDLTVAAHATIVALLDAFEARFIPVAAGRLARAEFISARQATSETILQWHSRIRELFQRAYPARPVEADEQLIDQFVNNLQDTFIKSYVLDQAPNTFTAALNNAQSKQANQFILGKPATNGSAGLHAFGATNNSKQKECWHCGKSGHVRTECDAWKKEKEKWVKYLDYEKKNPAKPDQKSNRDNRGKTSNNRGGKRNQGGRRAVNQIDEPTTDQEDSTVEPQPSEN